MELSFIEGLRRRWEVLGIQKGAISTGGRKSAKGKDHEEVSNDADKDTGLSSLVAGADEGMEDVRPVEKGMEEEAEMERIANQDGGEGESARLHIMKGAIVKTVITAAAEGASLYLRRFSSLPVPSSFISFIIHVHF